MYETKDVPPHPVSVTKLDVIPNAESYYADNFNGCTCAPGLY